MENAQPVADAVKGVEERIAVNAGKAKDRVEAMGKQRLDRRRGRRHHARRVDLGSCHGPFSATPGVAVKAG
jgi:hypothetical protein